ncbi:hypothetical protein PROFUN_04750 [Planoprotostelium fungivorum]|uniref:Uncharacterized protein n=1 Tax=Planoprotostelium fungivorum TaxID=1890364 RepID=A0A2P6NFZ7_9EUKA|nr:hypothetical protein PROFUN_04750 [Planoprotostelium fungivorum]
MTIKRVREETTPSWMIAHAKLTAEWSHQRPLPTSDPFFKRDPLEQQYTGSLMFRTLDKREKTRDFLQTIEEEIAGKNMEASVDRPEKFPEQLSEQFGPLLLEDTIALFRLRSAVGSSVQFRCQQSSSVMKSGDPRDLYFSEVRHRRFQHQRISPRRTMILRVETVDGNQMNQLNPFTSQWWRNTLKTLQKMKTPPSPFVAFQPTPANTERQKMERARENLHLCHVLKKHHVNSAVARVCLWKDYLDSENETPNVIELKDGRWEREKARLTLMYQQVDDFELEEDTDTEEEQEPTVQTRRQSSTDHRSSSRPKHPGKRTDDHNQLMKHAATRSFPR